MSALPEILGHDSARARLWRAAIAERLHHAYLFEGPEGVGKRLVALRLAMVTNCEAPGRIEPCGVCRSCTTIQAGTHPDVVWLEPPADRASGTIPVDSVRELVRQSGYHRFGSRFRLIIIDPAEALQPAAANALLKTLEEPPAGTGFILLAQSGRALLPTIVSRCQRVRFQPVPEPQLTAWLRARGVAAPAAVARIAQGCPGAALTAAEGEMEARVALRAELLTVLASGPAELFKWSEQVAAGGKAGGEAVERLLRVIEDLLRDVVVVGGGSDLPLHHEDAPAVVERWASVLWPGGVTACAEAVAKARQQLALNVTARLVIEALVARIAFELGPARRA